MKSSTVALVIFGLIAIAASVDSKPVWCMGPWSLCSTPCDPGTQNRTITCVDDLDPEGEPLADSACTDDMPADERACNEGERYSCPVPVWVSDMGDCDTACGLGGAQTAEAVVECQKNGVVVPEAWCPSAAKPGKFQACNRNIDCSPGACAATGFCMGDSTCFGDNCDCNPGLLNDYPTCTEPAQCSNPECIKCDINGPTCELCTRGFDPATNCDTCLTGFSGAECTPLCTTTPCGTGAVCESINICTCPDGTYGVPTEYCGEPSEDPFVMELDSPYCALDGIPELVTSVVANVLGIDESYIFVENYASQLDNVSRTDVSIFIGATSEKTGDELSQDLLDATADRARNDDFTGLPLYQATYAGTTVDGPAFPVPPPPPGPNFVLIGILGGVGFLCIVAAIVGGCCYYRGQHKHDNAGSFVTNL